MLNAEKYRAEILGKDFKFGLSNRICKCCYEECATCVFSLENNPNDGLSHACTIRKVKWLLSEYKEPIKLSRLEYETLKYFYKVKEYRYIVRSDNGLIWLSFDKPHKIRTMWASNKQFGPFPLFGDLFKFVRLADKEPTSIKDILDNCEVVNDAEE